MVYKLQRLAFKPRNSHLHIFLRKSLLKAQAFSVQVQPCPQEFSENGIKSLSFHSNHEISTFLQKGFSEINREAIGKALHGLCLKGFVPFDVFYSNTLVSMYSKFGRVNDARYVFDEMPDRNEASWNTMTSSYVKVRAYSKAIEFFKEMFEHGVKPSGVLVASLVSACDKSGSMFSEGIQVHGFVVKAGLLLCDVFVGTSLLHFYGTYGFVSESCKLFEEMPERNVVTWTSLMVGYSDNGELEKVIDIYKLMRIEKACCCNENTIALVLKACGVLGDEWLGVQVLGNAVKFGLEKDVSLANSLIGMFGNCGKVKEARRVFDRMEERDTISWNSIISVNSQNGDFEDSLRYLRQMRYAHGDLNSIAVSALLSMRGSLDYLKWGRGIHGLVMKSGLESNVCVGNTLLNMYSGAGISEDAELVFRTMRNKDLISWNSMVGCYAQNEESLKAVMVLAEMRRTGQKTSFVTITSALAACSNKEYITEGKMIHALAILLGLQSNVIIGNALVTMYGKSGMSGLARRVLEVMPRHEDVSWNALIGCCSENDEPNDAMRALNTMREEGVRGNYITIMNILGGFSDPNALRAQGMSVHGYAVRSGFDLDKNVQTSLVTMYAKCGDLNSSNLLFKVLSTEHSITWNAIIAVNAHHGFGEEALKLVLRMRNSSLCLDQFSLSTAMSASAELGFLEEGQQLHSLVVKLGFEFDQYVRNSTMDMYGKCGEMDDALRLSPPSSARTTMLWNVLISLFARHGRFDDAKESFDEMLRSGAKPDHVTFVSLLSACSHAGRVDEGLEYFSSMATTYGIAPLIKHCVCLIDLLGRSGRLGEAEAFLTDKPLVLPNNTAAWRSLLASCRKHKNLELARKSAERLLELDPSDDSAYVLLSNVYAANGKWDEAEAARALMESSMVKKRPACSWVKVRNEISKFGMGEKSHPRIDQIYEKLNELKRVIKESGYVADTSFGLHDTDEEQSELNLWSHSERIALAFAFISTPQCVTIRVNKNLRVCGDCHSVFKFVSGIFGRKIVLRDPYRFHHFSGGECSCGDYW